MDFGKSFASSLIFDLLLPLASTAIKAGVPHGDVISSVLDTSTGLIKESIAQKTAGTNIGDAVTHVFQNHLPGIIQAGTSILPSLAKEVTGATEFSHADLVMQAVEAFGKTLQH